MLWKYEWCKRSRDEAQGGSTQRCPWPIKLTLSFSFYNISTVASVSVGTDNFIYGTIAFQFKDSKSCQQ